jgi:electron-transferring-flavoprotein dehydrogenase
VSRFGLATGAPQKFGLGLKELWEVSEGRHRPGLAIHGVGWPLRWNIGGGSFVYHLDDRRVALGLVVHLDYGNPYLSPFEEFQNFKRHPALQGLLSGATRLSYGARAISEGGWQSVPKLAFPGGVLVGDAAGFVNVPRIKGSHNAIHSGMLAADHLAEALAAGEAPAVLSGYDAAWRDGPIGRDLRPVRNLKPLWSRFGLPGLALGGADIWVQRLLGFSPFGTLSHKSSDAEALRPKARHRPIAYPPPDGVITFDRASSLFVSGTHHAERQPVHLRVRDADLQRHSEYGLFGGPSGRYCPAGVYEWLEEGSGPRLQINAQNCLHCKTCDILDPNQNIDWTPPEGGQGPLYGDM